MRRKFPVGSGNGVVNCVWNLGAQDQLLQLSRSAFELP